MKYDEQDQAKRDGLPTGPLTSVDDPRLTAYALGELEQIDPTSKSEVEAFLAGSAEAREAVAELRSLSEVVSHELAAELLDSGLPAGAAVGPTTSKDSLGLTAEQRERVLLNAASANTAVPRGLLPRILPWVPAMAAGVLATLAISRMDVNPSEPGSGSAGSAALDIETASASGVTLDADEKRYGGRGSNTALDKNARAARDRATEEEPLEDHARFTEPSRKRGEEGDLGQTRARRQEPGPAEGAPLDRADNFDGLATGGRSEEAGESPPRKSAKGQDPLVYSAPVDPATDPVEFDHLERWSRVLDRRPPSESLSPGSPSPEPRREAATELRRMRDFPGQSDQDDAGTVERELYQDITETPVRSVALEPLSTFSVDVDTASYSNIRRFLDNRQLPPASAVRLEEMINYFDYDYPPPTGADPFSVSVEIAGCPWAPERRLVRIGLQAQDLPRRTRFDANAVIGATNLVFLLDVSGSMNSPNKLPLLKKGMRMLVENLNGVDTVSIVVYAGSSGLVLPPTSGINRERIFRAIEDLEAGGSTNGGAGIELAYRLAAENYISRGTNRVILGTDGDFNVGVSSVEALAELAAEKSKSDIFLTVLGFGTGNLQDSKLETLANKGNGHYAYIDSEQEAQKVLVREIGSTLHTVAKDVKLQVEFNPRKVREYRLLGYENRRLENHEFEDDTVDAGEIGAGHRVTALYEVTPGEVDFEGRDAWKFSSDLRYRISPVDNSFDPNAPAFSGELMNVSLRYKEPDEDESQLIEVAITDLEQPWTSASEDFRFAAAVAGFGLVLSDSVYVGSLNLDLVRELATEGAGPDPYGYRAEFLRLVDLARDLSNQ